jgi:hypothetical protein
MTKSIIPTFTTGIIAPELASSIELEKAHAALIQCENFIVDALGGVKNRPGTQYVDDAQDTSKLSRLIPFQFNTVQTYVLEFGDSNMRVIRDGGLVLLDVVDAAVYKWTLSASGTNEYYQELLAGGDPGLLETSYILEDGSKMTAGTFGSLAAGETDFGDNDTLGYDTRYVRLSDSTDPDSKADGYLQQPVLVATPYPIADVAALEFTQSADVLYVFHGNYNIRKITRASHTAWTVTDIGSINGPYKARVEGDDDIRISVLNTTGTTWRLESSSPIFGDTEIGDPVKLGFPIPELPDSLYWSWFVVTNDISDSIVDTTIQSDSVVYEQVQNPEFKQGLEFWEEHSDTASPPTNYLGYDFDDQTAVLFDANAAGDARMEQSLLTLPNVNHTLTVKLFSLTGAGTNQVSVAVGTASLLSDILSPQIINDTTEHTYDVLPTTGTIFISFDTTGATDPTTIQVERVSLKPRNVLFGQPEEYYTTDWRLASFNVNHGYPEMGIINEQRLMLGRNASEPQTIWPSKTGNFEDFDFSTPIVDTDSFSFNPPTPQINGIIWLLLQNGLNVGTAGELWKVFAASGGVITPTDVNIKIDSVVGSLDLKPLAIGNSIILTPRGKEEVTELTSSFETSGYIKRDLSVLASHLFKDRRIIRWAYAREPDSVIWCILDNGKLLGITYFKEYDIWAWHEHTTPLGEGFKDIAVIPNSSDDNIDDVYFIINRAVNGATPNYYIEQLNRRITSQEAAFGLQASGSPHDYKFLDSALTFDIPVTITNATQADPVVITATAHGFSDGDFVKIQNVKGMTEINNIKYKVANKAANTFELNDKNDNDIDGTGFTAYLTGGEVRKMELTLSNLDHLEGETVSVLADGRVEENLVVSSGSVTLKQVTSFAHIGIPYVSIIETPDIEILAETGSTQGRNKAITKADVYFKDTRSAEIASSNESDVYREITFWNESGGENPPDLFTGSKEITLSAKYRKTDRILIRNTKPLPIEVKRIIPDADYSG